ncbi:MAG: hypothetical protein ABR521_01490 [Gaiellaceae bacterium]
MREPMPRAPAPSRSSGLTVVALVEAAGFSLAGFLLLLARCDALESHGRLALEYGLLACSVASLAAAAAQAGHLLGHRLVGTLLALPLSGLYGAGISLLITGTDIGHCPS